MNRAEAARRFAEKAEDHYYVPKLREMYQIAAEALAEEPRKKAKWVYRPETLTLVSCYTCSNCKSSWLYHDVLSRFKYCPDCGAKMED